jgi:NRPS condensation-like uncharacterized protein
MNRSLGSTEHFLWLLTQTIPRNLVFCATITGSLTVEQLTKALAWVQHRHPLLAVRIVLDEQEQPRFVSGGVPSIPLRALEQQSASQWCQEVKAELLCPFSLSEGPLIRVVLLHSPEVCKLIITFDHCIGDGLSGAYLLRDILREVSEPGSEPQPLPECPPVSKLLPPTASLLNRDLLDDEAKSQKLTSSSVEVSKNRSSAEEESLRDDQLYLLHWSLSPEETATLISCCREEQTSVQGALCASFLLSIAANVSSQDKAVFKCISPINIRNYLVPPIGEDFGLYASNTLTCHSVGNSPDFWEIARDVKHQINSQVANGKMFEYVTAMNSYVSTKPNPIKTRQSLRERAGSDLLLTNLGRLNIPQQYGSLQLQELYLSVMCLQSEQAHVAVTTLGGNMRVTSSALESLIPKALAEKIHQGAIQRLRESILF